MSTSQMCRVEDGGTHELGAHENLCLCAHWNFANCTRTTMIESFFIIFFFRIFSTSSMIDEIFRQLWWFLSVFVQTLFLIHILHYALSAVVVLGDYRLDSRNYLLFRMFFKLNKIYKPSKYIGQLAAQTQWDESREEMGEGRERKRILCIRHRLHWRFGPLWICMHCLLCGRKSCFWISRIFYLLIYYYYYYYVWVSREYKKFTE